MLIPYTRTYVRPRVKSTWTSATYKPSSSMKRTICSTGSSRYRDVIKHLPHNPPDSFFSARRYGDKGPWRIPSCAILSVYRSRPNPVSRNVNRFRNLRGNGRQSAFPRKAHSLKFPDNQDTVCSLRTKVRWKGLRGHGTREQSSLIMHGGKGKTTYL